MGDTGNICTQVKAKANEYWMTSPEIRPQVFHWLDEHALKCDSCALFLEELAQQWSQSHD